MRKRISIIICTILCSASIGCDAINSSAQGPIKFKDTSQHWAWLSIQTAVEKKYVDGYEDGSFKPEQNLSRAEYLKMVTTAMKIQVDKPGVGDNWYTPYVNAAKTGLIQGLAYGDLGVDKATTRAQSVTIIERI
jgi:hypothetical protein